jgi:GDP-mannose 6-dehydrogenase
MKISVFGLGYVGTVCASCFAQEGHDVVGVDKNEVKLSIVKQGGSPIIEKDIDSIIQQAVRGGRLTVTDDTTHAVMTSDVSFICVGTPSELAGRLDLGFVRQVSEQIGIALRGRTDFHVVVVRSSVLPGTIRQVIIPVLEEYSGKKVGTDFGACSNPEFLREGSAVYDFYNPPKTIIGSFDERGAVILKELYAFVNGPVIDTTIEIAEAVKYTDNAWHALKVGFANEIGNICKALGIDSHAVMDIFCQDTKLNLSPYYLKPGFAFGGSCLPKDLRALIYKGRSLDLELPILCSIMPSNHLQIEKGIGMIAKEGKKNVGILGFSFKAGTDDLRESPMVEVIERLIGKGHDLRIYDRNVQMASLVGANRDYILNRIPHISRLMVGSIQDVVDHADVIVIGNANPAFSQSLKGISDDKVVIDFARIEGETPRNIHYEGICW